LGVSDDSKNDGMFLSETLSTAINNYQRTTINGNY